MLRIPNETGLAVEAPWQESASENDSNAYPEVAEDEYQCNFLEANAYGPYPSSCFMMKMIRFICLTAVYLCPPNHHMISVSSSEECMLLFLVGDDGATISGRRVGPVLYCYQ